MTQHQPDCDDFVPYNAPMVGDAGGAARCARRQDAERKLASSSPPNNGSVRGRERRKEQPADQGAGGAGPFGIRPGAEAQGDEMGRVGNEESAGSASCVATEVVVATDGQIVELAVGAAQFQLARCIGEASDAMQGKSRRADRGGEHIVASGAGANSSSGRHCRRCRAWKAMGRIATGGNQRRQGRAAPSTSAPTRERLQDVARSPSRPSETSGMVARPRRARPRARAGDAAGGRQSARQSAASRFLTLRWASLRAARPGAPEIHSSSPAVRRHAGDGFAEGHFTKDGRAQIEGLRVVSPPMVCRAAGKVPPGKGRDPASSALGRLAASTTSVARRPWLRGRSRSPPGSSSPDPPGSVSTKK